MPCKTCTYRGVAHNLLHQWRAWNTSARDKFPLHQVPYGEYLQAGQEFTFITLGADRAHMLQGIRQINDLRHQALRAKAGESANERRDMMEKDLDKYGAFCFKWIEEEEQLTTGDPAQDYDPKTVLKNETAKWARYWDKGPEVQEKVALLLRALRDYLLHAGVEDKTIHEFCAAMHKYPLKAPGIDHWSIKLELKLLADISKQELNDAQNKALQLATVAIPNLTNLHPAVKKQMGGLRTLCNTP